MICLCCRVSLNCFGLVLYRPRLPLSNLLVHINSVDEEADEQTDAQETFQTRYPGIVMTIPTKPILSYLDELRMEKKNAKKNATIGDTSQTVSSSRPTPLALQLPPDPIKESEQFKEHVGNIICFCGIHQHTHTCRKPPKGWRRCRLCKPTALNDGTKPLELVLEHEHDETYTINVLESEQERPKGSTSTTQQEFVGPYDPENHTPKEKLCSPLQSDSSRTIIWELDRPELDPLIPLEQDMTKEQIISRLFNEMLPSVDEQPLFEEGSQRVSRSRVDMHQFYEHDENNLFYGLLLWRLMEFSQLNTNYKSVQCLRRELMHCLRKMPLDSKFGNKTVEQHIRSRTGSQSQEDDIDTTILAEDCNCNCKPVRSSKRLQEATENGEAESTGDVSIEEKIELYSQLMTNPTGVSCFGGGELEIFLFAEVEDVNIAVYDEEDDALIRVEYVLARRDDRPTIHLLRTPNSEEDSRSTSSESLIKSPEYKYKLFTPKLKEMMKKLQALDTRDLRKLYEMVSDSLPERNGLVVDYNDMLTPLLGCNSNLLHLGSTEQSKAALFYIGPYINKDGVKITDALPILEKAREHAQNFPSIAEDSGTNKRQFQQVLTRTVNMLNGMIELSDTQIAASLLGMGASLCSDSFVTCDTAAYQKLVNNEIQRTKKGSGCSGFDLADEDSDEDSDEENEYYDEMDILCGDKGDELEEDDTSQADNRSLDPMESEDTGGGDDDFEEDADKISGLDLEGNNESGVTMMDEGNHSESETNTTRHCVTQSQKEDEGEDFAYINASFGSAPFYKMNDGTKRPVSYAALYRYRGEALKNLSRDEYCACVMVVEIESGEGSASSGGGRKKSKAYPFGAGLGMEKNYHQVLRSKLRIPKFTSSPPPPPRTMPQPPLNLDESDAGYEDQIQTYKRELDAWRKKADRFAHFYLTMFRPEDKLYEEGQICTYEYNWETFAKFYRQLRMSRYVTDKLRFDHIHRMIYSWRVDPERRRMLAEFRGRASTVWTAEEREASKAFFCRSYNAQQVDDGMDHISNEVQDLSEKESTAARKHLGHSKAILNTLGSLAETSEDSTLHTTSRESSLSAKSRLPAVDNVSTLPFNMTLDESKRQSHVKDTCSEADGNVSTRNKYRKIPNLDKKVEDYIKSQDLSADKDSVVQLAHDHFKAIRSGRADETDYKAPLLFVSGKPGNGKSKIIESLDGIVEIMKVGEQMKNAFMGSAAVNIRGTTLLKSWNIPVFSKNKGPEDKIRPWNPDELFALKRRFGQNIYNICAVVIDEVSTVQPYMLAYLNSRMQELFDNDKKLFGGRMVILVGDFDQKPPTAGGKGNTLPGSVMEYIELKGKPPTFKTAKQLGLAKMGGFLFSKFRYIKLTSQHRSGDPKHMAVISKMSNTGIGPTIKDLKNTYKKLSADDLASNDFRFATNIVTGNCERREINAWQAKRWAEYHGVNTIRWARNRKEESWKGRPRTEECVAHAMQNSCFWEFFPPGAMGYLNTYGINADDGLVNGTEIKYHSLSFEDKDEKRQFKVQCAQAEPGDIITLASPPTAINVELFADSDWDSETEKKKKKAMRREWLRSGKGSITKDGFVVIPISTRDGNKIESTTTYIPGCTGLGEQQYYYPDSQIQMKDYFPIEPAFSITVDKAQVRFFCAYFACFASILL